jgi:mRNA interferase RelE/StbE
MSGYTLEIRPAFRREFKNLPVPIQTKIFSVLELLKENPFPQGTKKLEGHRGPLYRVKIAKDYRLIYAVLKEKLLIAALKVGPRRDIYRRIQDLKV